ncbi:hypothetical protein GCM10025856_05440 [Methylophaga marina]|uniref:Uncharacterized protein n=1 Tax=Methylophaga marina TaxID=45495 RepID=A0ABN0T8Z2_9GAMM|nr:hypothetical protein [Methylophaga marina]BDZ72825.1 hypothetical protein GCM10025856_05440 [Methylophaga marina]
MSFQIYSSDFLPGHGIPVLVVTEPVLAGDGARFVAECHAFFCGEPESYALFTASFKQEEKSCIDGEEVSAAAKQSGEFHLYNYLAEKSNVRYQAILAGFGGRFSPSENKLLLQLHMRNFLSSYVESKIESHTSDSELKCHIQMVSRLSRVTTEKKI